MSLRNIIRKKAQIFTLHSARTEYLWIQWNICREWKTANWEIGCLLGQKSFTNTTRESIIKYAKDNSQPIYIPTVFILRGTASSMVEILLNRQLYIEGVLFGFAEQMRRPYIVLQKSRREEAS